MENDMISLSTTTTDIKGQFAGVYEVLNHAIATRTFPGCAFGVLTSSASGNRVVLQDALGHFTYEENAPAVTPETAYDVASLTKAVVTTASAMLLHQRGQLDLSTPVGEVLPGFVIGRGTGTRAHHVKIRHLLAHNSGLPGYVEFFRSTSSPAALYRACLELPLRADPGASAEYSDPGFILLGKALEVLVGEHLSAWAGREIFTPLGMESSRFCPRSSDRPLIPPTEEDTQLRQRRIQGEVQDENAWILKGAAGHAGLFSNVPDLLRFAAEILHAVNGRAEAKLLSRGTVDLFSVRQSPEGSSRALGWDTPSANSSSGHLFSPHSIGHLGFSGCSLWIDLDAGIAVTLLTNRTWPDRQNQEIRDLRPAFHDAVRQAL
jgi:CubicO group peptidase (beta-lactamase class C family)